jgi:hypothetical protein
MKFIFHCVGAQLLVVLGFYFSYAATILMYEIRQRTSVGFSLTLSCGIDVLCNRKSCMKRNFIVNDMNEVLRPVIPNKEGQYITEGILLSRSLSYDHKRLTYFRSFLVVAQKSSGKHKETPYKKLIPFFQILYKFKITTANLVSLAHVFVSSELLFWPHMVTH